MIASVAARVDAVVAASGAFRPGVAFSLATSMTPVSSIAQVIQEAIVGLMRLAVGTPAMARIVTGIARGAKVIASAISARVEAGD